MPHAPLTPNSIRHTEPLATLSGLTGTRTEGDTVVLTDTSGVETAVKFYKGIGWEVEVYYHQLRDDVRQQQYTGAQETLELSPLTVHEDEKSFTVEADGTKLCFQKQSGLFELIADDDHVLRTTEHPFSAHEQLIDLYEDLMSLKQANFSGEYGHLANDQTFKTRMARFQYVRPDGCVLGLPGQAGEMNRNGYRFQLYNTDHSVHIASREPLYQSWPILLHQSPSKKQWVGVFHDNPSRTFVDLGDFYQEQVTFESVNGNTRVYLLTSNTLADLSQKFATLLGKPALPPLWAFGYQQCRWSYLSTQEARQVVKGFEEADIPLDAFYYDIDYMDGYRVFTVESGRFGDLATFNRELKDKGIHTVAIIDPGVKIDDEYEFYRQVRDSDAVLKTPEGNHHVGNVWPGDVVFPDFGSEKLRKLWAEKQADWLKAYALDGVWNDMNEPADFYGPRKHVPHAVTERGPLRDEYNLYGYNMAKTSKEGWHLAHPNERGLIITRSGYPGVQQNAVIWHGDNHAWWEHLRMALQMAVTFSLCGSHYTGADVPGFNGNPSDDLAVRFFQLGALLPLYRGHSIFFGKDKEPYAFPEPTMKLIRDAIHLRYSLLSEWYTGFADASRTGVSPFLPVFTEDGTLVRDQATLFGKFLLAPVIERDQVMKLVYLPAGQWYPLGATHNAFTGNQWIALPVSLRDIPIFVKAGSVVVRNEVKRTTGETLKAPYTYEVYPDANGKAEGLLYADDGISVTDAGTEWRKLVWEGGEVRETNMRTSDNLI